MMTGWEQVKALVQANPGQGVMLYLEGSQYRARLMRSSIERETLKPDNSSVCAEHPEAAVANLYERVVEVAWKDLRPYERKLRDLGVLTTLAMPAAQSSGDPGEPK